MTATDRLRAMLDERGVEWTFSDGTVHFDDGEHWFLAWAYNDGGMCVSMGYLTPEQAVTATLGEETCRMIYDEEASGDELWPTEAYHCSECGKWVYAGKPNYCPSCGRKVEQCDRECPSETPSMPHMSELFGILRDSEKREDA